MTHDHNAPTGKPVELSDDQAAQIAGGGNTAGSAAPPAKGLYVNPVTGGSHTAASAAPPAKGLYVDPLADSDDGKDSIIIGRR